MKRITFPISVALLLFFGCHKAAVSDKICTKPIEYAQPLYSAQYESLGVRREQVQVQIQVAKAMLYPRKLDSVSSKLIIISALDGVRRDNPPE